MVYYILLELTQIHMHLMTGAYDYYNGGLNIFDWYINSIYCKFPSTVDATFMFIASEKIEHLLAD